MEFKIKQERDILKTVKRFTFLDSVIIFSIIALGIFLSLKSCSHKGSRVRVTAAGTEYVYSLDRDGIYEVKGSIGITRFEISNRRVHIIESACPNKICIAAGFSNPIVCMPNDVIITVETESSDDRESFDAFTE